MGNTHTGPCKRGELVEIDTRVGGVGGKGGVCSGLEDFNDFDRKHDAHTHPNKCRELWRALASGCVWVVYVYVYVYVCVCVCVCVYSLPPHQAAQLVDLRHVFEKGNHRVRRGGHA